MLKCPKCDEAMVTRDRNGIMIEECSGCRGVYLDRGELELLIDAESKYLATLPAGANADTTYQGRHRHGVVRQVFGEPDTNGANADAAAAAAEGKQATSGA
jgi:Zn-finger nucleic acid-binding protein